MSENQSRGAEDMAKYDQMSTEELEEILRLDMEAPEEQETDTEAICYIMGVLAKRNRQNGQIPNTAQESYESFKRDYMGTVAEPEEQKKPLRPCWVRSLGAIAAVLAVVCLLTVTANAFGMDIWEAVVTWTKETFSFGNWGQGDCPGTDGDLPYKSLQEALLANEIEEALAPTWIPDGYELTDISVKATPKQNIYTAIYHKNEISLRITVRRYLNSVPNHIEQSEDFAEIYEVTGVKYYLFSNIERTQVVWIKDAYECHIIGNLTIEELKMMIDSIEKG